MRDERGDERVGPPKRHVNPDDVGPQRRFDQRVVMGGAVEERDGAGCPRDLAGAGLGGIRRQVNPKCQHVADPTCGSGAEGADASILLGSQPELTLSPP